METWLGKASSPPIACFLCHIPFLNGKKNFVTPTLLILFGFINIVSDFRSLGGVLVVTGVLLGASVLKRLSHQRARANLRQSAVLVLMAPFAQERSPRVSILIQRTTTCCLNELTASINLRLNRVSCPSLFLVGVKFWFRLKRFSTHRFWDMGLARGPLLCRKTSKFKVSIWLKRQHGPRGQRTHTNTFAPIGRLGRSGFWRALSSVFVLSMIVRSLALSMTGSSPMRPLYLFSGVLLIWDILFSPFAGFRRLETAFLLVIVLVPCSNDRLAKGVRNIDVQVRDGGPGFSNRQNVQSADTGASDN